MRAAVISICGSVYEAVVAESFVERSLGLHAFERPPRALVIPGSSVHGFGLRQPIWVIGLDERGRGTGGRLLGRRRVAAFRGSAAVLEVPSGPSCLRDHRSHVVRWHR